MASLSPSQRLAAFGGLVLALGISAGGAVLLAEGEDAAAQEIPYQDAMGEAPTSAPVIQQTDPTPEVYPDDSFVIKRVLPINGPIKYGEWHWDDEGVPDGPLVVTVDLQARVISVFRDGYEIGAAAVLLGTDDHPTPVGVFPILQKNKDHVSNLYDAEMPYMMRLTWDGVAIHGSPVENGYASHGCVGTPNGFAEKLFSVAKLGDKVIVTDGKRIGVGDPLV
ncbi:L,D-transpeptidase family protein [Pseudoblastomonas halimionae]|uniref:L,D-transpeptidase family protein n=1 Tax=Alteriqipengyuania halimionae TaxID=1926630 RepID=A0A6I4U390_9SPHN|nr:L,D-transpeptidase family protein [Alteriqipengyuania halimionae]MXP10480.1 L,D-transpeptidase family protein [Alteriqipengyuania halimionae]